MARGGITRCAPGWVEADARWDLRVFGFEEVDHLVFGVPGVGIAERFRVDGFEVGQVTLMVQSFTELQGKVSQSSELRSLRGSLPTGRLFGQSSLPSMCPRTSQNEVRDR